MPVPWSDTWIEMSCSRIWCAPIWIYNQPKKDRPCRAVFFWSLSLGKCSQPVSCLGRCVGSIVCFFAQKIFWIPCVKRGETRFFHWLFLSQMSSAPLGTGRMSHLHRNIWGGNVIFTQCGVTKEKVNWSENDEIKTHFLHRIDQSYSSVVKYWFPLHAVIEFNVSKRLPAS
jgi:hypothetical protein